MPQTVNINGVAISYPIIGDTEWGVEATKFAELVGVVLQKIGQGNQSTTNNIVIGSISSPGNLTVASGDLSVSGNTALTGNLTTNGTANLNGNTNLGNANTDTIAVTGILNVDTNTLYVNPTDNRVGINTATPTVALDVIGGIKSSAGITGASATLTDLTVDTNLIKTNSTDNRVGINTTTPQEALDVTGKILVSSDITVGGVIVADDSTNVTTAPPITFTGDTDTGIGRSAANTLDFVTGGVSRARISSTGLQSSVVPDLSGSNTNLFSEYKCRAWINFDGFLSSPITPRGSGNILSITKGSVGVYTITFINNMPDVNYSITMAQSNSDSLSPIKGYIISQAVGNFVINGNRNTAGTNLDANIVCCAVFR